MRLPKIAAAMTSTAAPSVATATQGAPQGPIYIDTQHDNMVHDAQLDYYGCKLATSSSGKKVIDFLWFRLVFGVALTSIIRSFSL